MFEKVQSLPENNGNSWLMTVACHALISCLFVCPWSCSRCLEPDLQPSRSFRLARTPACRHAMRARHGRTPARPACPRGAENPRAGAEAERPLSAHRSPEPPVPGRLGCGGHDRAGILWGASLRAGGGGGNSCCRASHRNPQP